MLNCNAGVLMDIYIVSHNLTLLHYSNWTNCGDCFPIKVRHTAKANFV